MDTIASWRWDIVAVYVVGVAVAVVSIILFKKYIAPWLNEKKELLKQQLGAEQYKELTERIKTFMACAEVQLGANTGAEKSKLVISWIKKLFPDIREDYVQALIDGFMKALANDGIVHMKEK